MAACAVNSSVVTMLIFLGSDVPLAAQLLYAPAFAIALGHSVSTGRDRRTGQRSSRHRGVVILDGAHQANQFAQVWLQFVQYPRFPWSFTTSGIIEKRRSR